MSILRHLLFLTGIAIGFPLALMAIGVWHCYANGDSLSAIALVECLYFVAVAATVFTGAGITLVLLNYLFPLKPTDLPEHNVSTNVSFPGREIAPPKPYPVRLARFLGIAPSDLETSSCRTPSDMTFWTSVTTFIRRGPKPPVLIRLFLERIRHAVRGQESVPRPK